ncbi:MAG TPA: hypothetical protein VFR23_23270 [Jiangellaceae bacterium]|nr:hypothetical protein [Jiangellaceae bacterium]
MSDLEWTITVGSELPDRTLHWQTADGATIDFSTGYTWTLRVGNTTGVLQKTSGITGAATDPNVTIVWAAGEWDNVPPGNYSFTLTPRRTSDSKDREPLRGIVHVLAAIPAPPP